jgi:Clostripain family
MTDALTKRHWTVLVYLAGDNSLDAAAVSDLNEMKRVGSTSVVTLVAQIDRSGSIGATRYLLRKGTPLAKDIVKSLGETNTGDPAVLEAFAYWAIANYPADHYLLVIWNHGAGWDDSNLYKGDYFGGVPPPVVRRGIVIKNSKRRGAKARPVRMGTVRAVSKRARRALFGSTVRSMIMSRAIAFDDQAKDFLDNMELKHLLTRIRRKLKRKIDIVGFDACLMSMIEVSYQIKDAVQVTCGSEEEEPNEGWPYNSILKALAAKPTMTPDDLATTIVDKYMASYQTGDDVTFSATALTAVPALAAAIGSLGKALLNALTTRSKLNAIVGARAQVQEYSAPYDEYCDLADLCDLLPQHVADSAIRKACDNVRKALRSAVLATGAKGSRVAHSNGISIYFPKNQVCPLYVNLDFAKANSWAAFISRYTAGVHRRR